MVWRTWITFLQNITLIHCINDIMLIKPDEQEVEASVRHVCTRVWDINPIRSQETTTPCGPCDMSKSPEFARTSPLKSRANYCILNLLKQKHVALETFSGSRGGTFPHQGTPFLPIWQMTRRAESFQRNQEQVPYMMHTTLSLKSYNLADPVIIERYV